jgi:hypothetical protein
MEVPGAPGRRIANLNQGAPQLPSKGTPICHRAVRLETPGVPLGLEVSAPQRHRCACASRSASRQVRLLAGS